ncbi:MAG: hypothetical protein IJM30_09885 [Thermoguttaceae bacterium]|nr:hypothetical protein [Thermoguttaceae bacterium]
MFRNLFRLFARSARPAAQKASRKLRLETLENRELLSASPMPFVGPPTFEVWLASQTSLASASEASSSVVIPVNIEQGDDSTFECELIETTVDTETVGDDEPEGRVRSVVFDPSSLPENAASDDVVILYDSDNNEIGSIEKKRPGAKSGGDITYWGLSITVSQFNGLPANNYPNKPYPLLEHCDKASGGFNSESQYVTMVLPTLPAGYSIPVSVYVTVNGVRTLATDQFQIARQNLDGVPTIVNTVNGQFQHCYSGGGVGDIYYLLAKNNAAVEQDKTIEVKLGGDSSTMPSGDPSASGGAEYFFYYINQSVTATIIDDDHWEVSATPVSADLTPLLEQDGNGNFIPQVVDIYEDASEGSRYAYVNLERNDNGDVRSGDLTYPITVALNYSGQATTADFGLCYYDVDEQEWMSVAPQNQNGITAEVAIPIGATNLLLRVEANNDLVIERLYETLSVSPANPHYLANQYDLVTTTISNRIKDDDKFALVNVQFRNNLPLGSDPSWDPTTYEIVPSVSWQDEIHWVNAFPNLTLPIAYSCNDVLVCDGTINGTKDDSLTYYVRFKTKNNKFSNWVELIGNTARANLSQDFETILGSHMSLYDSNYTLEWQFHIEGENVIRNVSNISSNPLYVTYNSPNYGMPLQLTVVHTGCIASSGVPCSSESVMFNRIWTQFQSKTISKVILNNGSIQTDGTLSFYGKALESSFSVPGTSSSSGTIQNYAACDAALLDDPTSSVQQTVSYARAFCNKDLIGLLSVKDGTCGMWQYFAHAVIGVQGISGATSYFVKTIDPEMLLKIKSNDAQGTSSPQEWIWHGHALIKYEGKIYDPSYGLCYGREYVPQEEQEDEDNALTNFVKMSVHSYGKKSMYGTGDDKITESRTYYYEPTIVASSEADIESILDLIEFTTYPNRN